MTFGEILQSLYNLVRGPMSTAQLETALDEQAKERPGDLNWRKSIVDLLRVLDLDSSMAARARLAKELGYDGNAPDGSEEKNLWLHKAVMQKVADHGIEL